MQNGSMFQVFSMALLLSSFLALLASMEFASYFLLFIDSDLWIRIGAELWLIMFGWKSLYRENDSDIHEYVFLITEYSSG